MALVRVHISAEGIFRRSHNPGHTPFSKNF